MAIRWLRAKLHENENARKVDHFADVQGGNQQLLYKKGQGHAAKSKNRDTICKRDNR